MELRQLVYFDAVARHCGFTRAAEHLHVAQPALSAQIQRLERELGVPLLARTTRRVSVTPAGEIFWARVRTVLAELDLARAEVGELTSTLHGNVRLGATLVLGPIDLPQELARFNDHHPGISLSLRSGLVAGLLTALDDAELDLVLGPHHEQTPQRFTTTRLADEELVLITPPARTGRVTGLAEVKDEPFVCLSRDSGLFGLLQSASAAAGFEAHVQFETYSPASIRELVSAGLGVALLARSAIDAPGPAVAVQPLTVSHPPIALIQRRGRRLTPAAAAFRRYLLRRFPPASA